MPVAERFQGANVVDASRLSPYWGEHAARYVFAERYISGKLVLDIACGTGFGVGLMKATAASVTGVDVDLAAARDARSECGDNSFVLLGDGLSLPFADASFDVVTSFETLEHLHARSDFLAELKRVMKETAVLLLSTPNANYTRPVNGKPVNQFHIHEYLPEELRDELAGHFVVSEFLGQTLAENFRIPPFEMAQLRLPKDPLTQVNLFAWKVLNKMPLTARERFSERVWGIPFYPTERDYIFSSATIDHAPTLLAVCSRRK
jgi:ubiquinone/menaquinone biosynthesis C-methylase UbiE